MQRCLAALPLKPVPAKVSINAGHSDLRSYELDVVERVVDVLVVDVRDPTREFPARTGKHLSRVRRRNALRASLTAHSSNTRSATSRRCSATMDSSFASTLAKDMSRSIRQLSGAKAISPVRNPVEIRRMHRAKVAAAGPFCLERHSVNNFSTRRDVHVGDLDVVEVHALPSQIVKVVDHESIGRAARNSPTKSWWLARSAPLQLQVSGRIRKSGWNASPSRPETPITRPKTPGMQASQNSHQTCVSAVTASSAIAIAIEASARSNWSSR